MRLQPLAGATQTLLDFDLLIEPPATVISFRDYYGNAVHDFGVAVPARPPRDRGDERRRHPRGRRRAARRPGRRRAGRVARRSGTLAGDEALADELAEFLGPSAYIPLADESAALAEALARRGSGDERARLPHPRRRPRARDASSTGVGTTTVESSVAEVLAGGSGVCQDFAHVLISLCRHVGPPRSLRQRLPRQRRRRRRASHAWVEAYVPPYGWLGIDATLGTLCTGQHVKVGVGRDYADVAVLRGTYQGGGEAELEVRGDAASRSAASVEPPQLRGGGDEPIARLVAIQNLGAMRQFQRGAVMTQAMGGMTQTLAVEELPPPRAQRRPEDGPPSQQPQQQQQQRGAATR